MTSCIVATQASGLIHTTLADIAWELTHTGEQWCVSRIEIRDADGAANKVIGTDDSDARILGEQLADRLQDWSEGRQVDFADLPITLGNTTSFRERVTRECRNIGWGQTITYGELAKRAGRPGAARAVGRVMACNPLPIVVPCHRVLASNGRMQGFSAPGGIATKEKFLEMESSLANDPQRWLLRR